MTLGGWCATKTIPIPRFSCGTRPRRPAAFLRPPAVQARMRAYGAGGNLPLTSPLRPTETELCVRAP
jgi:hypothetical protein